MFGDRALSLTSNRLSIELSEFLCKNSLRFYLYIEKVYLLLVKGGVVLTGKFVQQRNLDPGWCTVQIQNRHPTGVHGVTKLCWNSLSLRTMKYWLVDVGRVSISSINHVTVIKNGEHVLG